jgi:hypothetical protein
VGSSLGSTTGAAFPEAVRRTPGRAAVELEVVGAATGAAVDDEGQNS